MVALPASNAEFDALVGSLTRTYHLLTNLSDRLHGGEGVTTGIRSVLLLLAREGPMTLSQIAEHRAVSRQFIQRMGADLIARGWVAAEPNPRHKRSPKLVLTPTGWSVTDAIQRREASLGPTIFDKLTGLDFGSTRGTLDQLNDALATHLAACTESHDPRRAGCK